MAHRSIIDEQRAASSANYLSMRDLFCPLTHCLSAPLDIVCPPLHHAWCIYSCAFDEWVRDI